MLILLGNLHEAAQLFENVLMISQTERQRFQMVAAVAHFGIGLLQYAWNNLDQAADHIRLGLEMGQPWIYMSALLPGYITLARIEQARHQFKAADQALDNLEVHVQAGHLTHMVELVEINRIRQKMMRGNLASARKWALRYQPFEEQLETDVNAIWRYVTYAEIMIAQGNAEYVLDLLKRLNARCALLSLEWMRLDVQLLQCAAYWSLKQYDEALALLREILTRAEPEGHIRLFLDRGPMIETMLHEIDSPADSSAYVAELLRAFEAEARHFTWVVPNLSNSLEGKERLSPREIEILSLVAQGASNRAIAEQLFISEGTVKTHVKHILRKLNAQNRTDAIAKARAQTLIN